MNDYIPLFYVDVITYLCPNSDDCLVNLYYNILVSINKGVLAGKITYPDMCVAYMFHVIQVTVESAWWALMARRLFNTEGFALR